MDAENPKDALTEMLNRAIARTLGLMMQYLWQSVMAVGLESAAIRARLKAYALEALESAEALAKRVNYLGGVPTTRPNAGAVGGSLEEMLRFDLEDEQETIALCREGIQGAAALGDSTTRLLLERLLARAEEHHDELSALLGRPAPEPEEEESEG